MTKLQSTLLKYIFKLFILVWMGVVIFAWLLLFGPDEFWWLVGQIGLSEQLQLLRAIIYPFFIAGYQG